MAACAHRWLIALDNSARCRKCSAQRVFRSPQYGAKGLTFRESNKRFFGKHLRRIASKRV